MPHTSDLTTVRVTCLDADCRVLWQSPILIDVAIAKRTAFAWAMAILPYAGRDALPSLARTEAIKIEEKCFPVVHLDDVETDGIVQRFRRYAADPGQLDWTGTPRPTPQW